MVKADQVLEAWDAQEYIQRKKSAGWYIGLILIGAILCVGAFFLQWWTSIALIVVSVIALLIYSSRAPRMLHYELTNTGVKVGQNIRSYKDFKSFGVLQHNNHFSIIMLPRKRFAPRFIMYFPEEKGEKIVDILGARLPMQPVKLDALDKIVDFLHL